MSDCDESSDMGEEDDFDVCDDEPDHAYAANDEEKPSRETHLERQDAVMSEISRALLPALFEDDGSPFEFMVVDVVFINNEAVLFGRTAFGASVSVFVTGWYAYLYIEVPKGHEMADVMEILNQRIEAAMLLDAANRGRKHFNKTGYIQAIEMVTDLKSILGYDPSPPKPLLKIYVTEPRFLRPLRECFEKCHFGANGQLVDGGHTQTFNSSVETTLQFMVDVGMMGCHWCTVSAFGVESAVATTCQIERHGLLVDDLSFAPEKDTVAPLRLLSFDLEAAGRRGVFPQASMDPVIQIALHFRTASLVIAPVLLSLRRCDPIDGAHILCFEDERDLLMAFRDLVLIFDCDVFSGYNICNFDFLYLRDRAVALGCNDEFERMTKLVSARHKMFLRETVFQSVQMGKRKRVRVSIPGRVCLDMLTCIQNNQGFKLEKYTLNAVSAHFLNDTKVDLPFTQITPLWERDAAGRKELGVYCLKDAQLPFDLMEKLDSLTQTIEMARSAGIPFDWVLQRGIMVRNSSLLLRRAKARGFVFPLLPHKPADAVRNRFEGATVLDATCGIHQYVSVLDFSAMYPSIIRAHNLCYCTILPPPPAPPPTHVPYEQHGGQRFVKSDIIKGLVPEVVEHLGNCRAKAKAAYAAATDPMVKRVNKAREMAFKICSNSIYGALGSSQSMLPLMQIAATVTAIGRNDILTSKGIAERLYPNAKVIYGDTDSIFVRFVVSDPADTRLAVTEAMEKAHIVVAAINDVMQKPKNITYEKTYSTILLLSKKRYGGLLFSENHKWGEEPPTEIKGMQCVRRDGCALVRDLVRECLTSILHTGDITEAVAKVQSKLLDVKRDNVPVQAYAISKTLRKTMQDCSQPMTRQELYEIRQKLSATYRGGHAEEQLSYAEIDAAIYAKIKLVWRSRVKLPHVVLAWKLRLADPGKAPVLGESLSYIVTTNGCKQIADKVATLEHVLANVATVIDREYYIKSLEIPMENIFYPIALQRLLLTQNKNAATKDDEVRAKKMAKDQLWACVMGVPMTQDAAKRKASIEASPIGLLFKKQKS